MSDQRGIVQLMPWQREVAGLVNAVPTVNTLLLAGGRGGGKSVLIDVVDRVLRVNNGR